MASRGETDGASAQLGGVLGPRPYHARWVVALPRMARLLERGKGHGSVRILLLSDNFTPESNAPANRALEHGRAWVRAGHEVTVVTCAPNFPQGRVYAGYRNRWHQTEVVDGIRVVRVKTYIAANAGFLKRTLDYVSFMVSGFFAGLFEKRPDVVIGTSPQFFCALGAWALATVRRVPFVMEVRDLWPESIVAVGALKPGFIVRRLEAIEMMLYHRAKWIVVVTKAFKRNLVGRGIPASKIDVVFNGVDLAKFGPVERDDALAKEIGLEGKFVAGYLGTVGMAHAIHSLLDAAELLKDEPDIRILIAGAGAAWSNIDEQRRARGLDNVVLLPSQPREKMPRLWSLCDVAVVHLKNTPLFATVIPSKIFEAMAMQRPILIGLPAGEATGIVEETGTGLAVPAEDPAALAASIRELRDDPEARGGYADAGASAAEHFSRAKQAEGMLAGLARRFARPHRRTRD